MTQKLPPIRPAVARMAGYVPGEQPRPGERVIKLNTNENPYPPSPRVTEVLRTLDPEILRRYPQPNSDLFRDEAARLFGLTRDHVLAGNGSDEILAMLVRTVLGKGDVLAYPDPTYSLYPVLADIHELKVAEVPWETGWKLPVEALLRTGAKAIFFANPNAPSGTLVDLETIRALAKSFDGAVLVDEAYVDFAGEGTSAVALMGECPNVIVSRTLSKAYSLAGLRFGFALAHPGVIAEALKVKDSYNCDALAIQIATAALQDQAHARGTWDRIIRERERLTTVLTQRGWNVIPSNTNFLLATVPNGQRAADLYAALKAKGILIRYFGKPGLDDKLRITVGTPEENDALLNALPGA